MLTKKQYELITFINLMIKETGVSPSFEEMKQALGLKSKSGIHRLITGLQERGYIRRLPHRARALEIIKLPKNLYEEKNKISLNLIKNDFIPANDKKLPANENTEIPFLGKIAAGKPIEAISDLTNHISIPANMLGSNESYGLEIEGDSMIEAGIFNGDVVVIERCDTAENGSIVVALIDNEEATLKRIRTKGNRVALEPANINYETKIFGPDRVQIQGKLVGLIRTYH
ncbi:MAG: transcriptional repressor LexA [Pseudomonadota bacterium]|nr:transcriptional repressor LexA [Pseudomonadota bacterium]